MKNASPERPRHIDRLREGSCSITITPPDDDSPIRDMISIEERLFVVKDRGIYEIFLADQTDPKRTNPSVPNTLQRLLPFGAQDAWVGAVVLTARVFFLSSCFDQEIGRNAFNFLLGVAQDIAGAKAILQRYLQQEAEAQQSVNPKIGLDHSFVLPSISNVEATCNEFLQRMDHAQRELFKIAQLFFSDVKTGFWDGLKAKVDAGPQDFDNFAQFLAEATDFFKHIRNARNCAEHPRLEQRLVVLDFKLDTNNVLVPPTIEVVHPKTPMEACPVGRFFIDTIEILVSVVEYMIVFLCARNVKQVGGLQVYAIELPPERRKFPHVRFSYGTFLNGNLVPFG
ncbi:hypothetical protein ACUZ9P_12375 [Desulfovibrio sp. QI0430]